MPHCLPAFFMHRGHAKLTSLTTRVFPVYFIQAALLATLAMAQQPQQPYSMDDPRRLQIFTSFNTAPGTGVLIFNVYSERNGSHLDRQALLKLVDLDNHAASWRTTEDNTMAVFTDVAYGSYDIEVSAVGYLSTHKQIQITNTIRSMQTDVVLHRDPDALNLDVDKSVLPPKARKATKRAVYALKSGNLKEAQKQLDEAYKSSPASPDLNFLLGYLYFQKKDYAQAESYLEKATTLNPRNTQALTLLGRTGLEKQDYPIARSALERAVLNDAENWLPHSLLADAYLHQENYDKARNEAEIAITKGKNNAGPAQLVLGKALAVTGHETEAVQALNQFLDQSPHSPMANQVRFWIAGLASRENIAAAPEPTIAKTNLEDIDPLAALPSPSLSLKVWKAPTMDDLKPTIASGVECPASQVAEETGRRAQELVGDVARFAAVEDLFHQSLDKFGVPVRSEVRKYNYVGEISEPQQGILSVDEYRTDKLALNGYPDSIASSGFAALALVFHPDMRETFAISCEGLGSWQGQPTWIVQFQQRADRPNHMHSYKVGNQVHPVALRGRAWISADKFQILRMEAEMMSPIPEIQLASEYQVVEYGPVPFAKRNTVLWLPKSAEIYFDFRKHRYYRRHSFDHYMLYSIETDEQRKVPGSKAYIKDPSQDH